MPPLPHSLRSKCMPQQLQQPPAHQREISLKPADPCAPKISPCATCPRPGLRSHTFWGGKDRLKRHEEARARKCFSSISATLHWPGHKTSSAANQEGEERGWRAMEEERGRERNGGGGGDLGEWTCAEISLSPRGERTLQNRDHFLSAEPDKSTKSGSLEILLKDPTLTPMH
ncbi:hypothetical protein NQZ68_013945 [Dissostichus eleginoides]|nr:hypothetical protein NQZ68_013945 [Dissostichus eleginoides]